MKNKKGITLAEVTVALAIIGVIAMLLVPKLINSTHQLKYKTGVKKSVKAINDALSTNIANGRKSAYYTNADMPLFYYIQEGMKVIEPNDKSLRDNNNSEFYTKDGIRYEFARGTSHSNEFNNVKTAKNTTINIKDYACGTKDMNIGGTSKIQQEYPCVILVDTNGDAGPNLLSDNTLYDMFLILVTDKTAMPYGTAAQRVYYTED